jgi:hypothetical protein
VKLLPVVGGTLFFAFAACQRHSRSESSLENWKVEPWQKTLAVDAANHLREVFNHGTCQQIYTDASAYFRSQDSLKWGRECELLKKKIGSWRAFDNPDAQRCARPEVVVCIGQTDIDIAFLLTNTGPQLYWIAVREDERHWKQIPPRPFLYRLMDPIPINVIQNGRPS